MEKGGERCCIKRRCGLIILFNKLIKVIVEKLTKSGQAMA